MEWQDEGTILNVKRHGESSAIVEVFTRQHGRHLGLVKGARSQAKRPLLQPGNQVQVVWRARLEEHLGNWALEGLKLRAAFLMENRHRLDLASSILALSSLIPERDPHEDIALAIDYLFAKIEADLPILADYVRFEMMVLQTLGFGIDMTACAVTGAREGLTHVSPRSGRAVCFKAAKPYLDKLLPLPEFLKGGTDESDEQVLFGLRLTGYFLNCHVYETRQLPMPEARGRILARLASLQPVLSGKQQQAILANKDE